MALSVKEVTEIASVQLDNIEDKIDEALRVELSKFPFHNPVSIPNTMAGWRVIQALWPRYEKAGWTKCESSNGYYNFTHVVNFSSISRRQDSGSKALDIETELRAIKM